MDALSDPKKFLTIAEKRADQMKALGIDTVHMTTNTHLKLLFYLIETLRFILILRIAAYLIHSMKTLILMNRLPPVE